MVFVIGTFTMRREFQRLCDRLSDNLRAEHVHSEMRHLRGVGRTAVRISRQREPHLHRRLSDNLPRLERRVDDVVVADETVVEGRVRRMRGQRKPAAEQCQIEIRSRRQMLHIFFQPVQEGVDAGVRRRRRLLFFRFVRRLVLRVVGLLLFLVWVLGLILGSILRQGLLLGEEFGHGRDWQLSRRRSDGQTDDQDW